MKLPSSILENSEKLYDELCISHTHTDRQTDRQRERRLSLCCRLKMFDAILYHYFVDIYPSRCRKPKKIKDQLKKHFRQRKQEKKNKQTNISDHVNERSNIKEEKCNLLLLLLSTHWWMLL